MYHGWTESQEQIDARTLRRGLNEDAINLYFRQTSEGDADELANIVDWVNTDPAHMLVAGDRDENPAETAYRMERDGTEPSPTIWGGEVYYQNHAGGDDMPF